MQDNKSLPIVLAITGASGFVYGLTLLKFFVEHEYPVELVISSNAIIVAKQELGLDLQGKDILLQIKDFLQINHNLRVKIWDQNNIAASISSGSYRTQGMIIAPCSMGTMANIAAGTSNNLISRAADVILKERRRLVLVARETPLSTIHLRNMLTLSEMGAIILPAAPGFYHAPITLIDQINFVVGKTLDVFGIDNESFKRWTGKDKSIPQYLRQFQSLS